MTNRECVDDLVNDAEELGKLKARSAEGAKFPFKENDLQGKIQTVLARMKSDIEVVPGVQSEPFQTTPPRFEAENDLPGGVKPSPKKLVCHKGPCIMASIVDDNSPC